MRFYWLILGTLAVWRITHLLHAEDGPWEWFARMREAAGSGFWGGLFDCFYCLSVWIALPVAGWVGTSWMERILLWPALSGGAILLERITVREPGAPPATYYYENEEEHDVLRTESDATQRSVSTRQ